MQPFLLKQLYVIGHWLQVGKVHLSFKTTVDDIKWAHRMSVNCARCVHAFTTRYHIAGRHSLPTDQYHRGCYQTVGQQDKWNAICEDKILWLTFVNLLPSFEIEFMSHRRVWKRKDRNSYLMSTNITLIKRKHSLMCIHIEHLNQKYTRKQICSRLNIVV